MEKTEKGREPSQNRDTHNRSGNSVSQGAGFGIPNSMMTSFLNEGNISLLGNVNSLKNSIINDVNERRFDSNAVIQRQLNMPHNQIPSAEAEADRLSEGVRGSSPDAVRREMGSRLNADLSGIRFHSDLASESSNTRMGSRAWTSGRDVYFGKGGFEPRVAAHELVHTVQQGAVSGSVKQSVTPGTVQMWWPFNKKSDYDEDRTPEDIADSLVRIQAGFTASDERETEERNKAYSKKYDSELKRLRKANRGRIREGNGEEQDKQAARNAAEQSASNLRVKRKDYVNKDDKRKYDSAISSITRDTYEELLDRRDDAAQKLFEYFSKLSAAGGESQSKNDYLAANSEAGSNFKLYNQLIQTIDMRNANNPAFQSMKEQVISDRQGLKENDPVIAANRIIQSASSADNRYAKSEEGIHKGSTVSHDNKEYYKKLYAKKKTKLDRMASVYKRRKKATENNRAEIGLIDEPDTGKLENNIISTGMKENDDDFILEGLPQNNKKKDNKKSDNLISTSNNESEDSFILEGMPENNIITTSNTGVKKSNNIISTSMKDEDEDEESSISNGALKQKVEEYISTASRQDGMKENDDIIEQEDTDQIIRQPGNLTIHLADNFSPTGSGVSSLKNKNSKSGFVNNLAKGASSANQFTLSLINQDLLKNANAYTEYVNPSVSGGIGGLTALTGLAGTVTGASDTIRNFKNVDAGGSRWDYINSGIDTLGSGANMVNGGLAVAKNMANVPMIGETMKTVSEFGGPNLVPGLSIAFGGATMITGAIEGIRGQKSINKIDDQIEALKGMSGRKPTKDQQKLMQIFNQGRRVAELHRTGGAVKAVGGAIALGTGIALLTGPLAPITAAVLGIAGAAAGISSFIYGRSKKRNIREGVTAEEMGFDNWKDEIERVRAQFPGEKLSDKEIREIILKGNGYDAKTRTQAFKQINMKRAKMLLDIAEERSPLSGLAEKVINALGVSRKKGRFAGGAQKLIAEKLGG